jgi:hypothetical protein
MIFKFHFTEHMNQMTQPGTGLGRLLVFLAFVATTSLAAQSTTTLRGRVVDASNGEGIPFGTVVTMLGKVGVATNGDGYFTLKNPSNNTELKVSSVGYHVLIYKIPKSRDSLFIKLEQDVTLLKEVVIKPKKYRNKNNPAVELIRNVIDNRKANRVEGFDSYREEQYEKIFMGFTDVSNKMKNKRLFRSWKVLTDNTDTTLLKGSGVTPAYMQESIQDFYSQKTPKRSKIWVNAQQKVIFPLMDNDGIERYLRYLYQESDIYDDYVVLLTDHFVSPISDNAPIFYRYYPADTIDVEGSKVVRLEFYPRNKTDMLLQGEIYVALDSTYPVTRITYSVNPNINLNWVRTLEMDQKYKKLATGKWVMAEENYTLDFGVAKRGMGVFARRYVSHRDQQMGIAIADSIFQKTYELRTLRPKAEVTDTSFWANSRHTQLTAAEANTYKVMDSLKNTLLFKRIAKTTYILISGHYKPFPGLEIGRINTFFSFNPVEGYRARFGGRTNPEFSKRINFEGYGAYGFKDEKFKFGVAANISLTSRPYNRFPYNMLRINYQQDLLTPGVLIIGTFAPTSIATSITRGTNDRFFFQKKLIVQYEREYHSRFSYMIGFEHKDLAPLGSLSYVPTDEQLIGVNNVISAKPYFQVRYAPGEEYYQSANGWRQRIKFKTISQVRYARGIKGIGGSQYAFDEVTASIYRFTNTPPVGYNYCYVEAGGVFGKVPYSLLTVHRANQTFGYRFMAYNLMNFMEFVSDRYVSLNMEQSFYGFFTNKLPLVRRLKLREFATVKVLYGQISPQNTPRVGAGLYELPKYPDGRALTYAMDDRPYVEASLGIGNIFRVLRVDLVRRFTYLEHPETRKYGLRVAAQVQF